MAASKDKQFKAKCCFMAAKCEYNDHVNKGEITWEVYFIPGIYYKMMVAEYKNTKYYEEAIRECTYFSNYVASIGSN